MGDVPGTSVRVVDVDDVRESASNPRSAFDPVALGELAASIRERGLLVPLLVRPVNGHYELIDGARRLRACRLADLGEVPVLVQGDWTDAAAREASLVANLQRADVHPLDEARALGHLIGPARELWLVADVAKRIGKSKGYVWDRLKLLDLVPLAQELLTAGRLTVPHATVLARLVPDQQTKAIREGLFEHEAALSLLDEDDDHFFEDDEAEMSAAWFAGRKARSVRELEAWVARNVRFDPHQAAAAAPLDFGPVAERVDEAAAQPGRGKKVVHVTYEYHVAPEAKGEERTYCHGSWKRADGHDDDSPACDHAVLGVIVVGAGYGQAFPVCVHKECDRHWADEKRAKAQRTKGLSRNGTFVEPRADAPQREKWEAERLRDEAERAAWTRAAPAITDAVVAALKKAKPLVLAPILTGLIWEDEAKRAAKLFGPVKTVDDLVRCVALGKLLQEIGNTYSGPRTVPAAVKPLGIDVAAVVKASSAATPETGAEKPRAKAKATATAKVAKKAASTGKKR